jgi:WD40 repeat protein
MKQALRLFLISSALFVTLQSSPLFAQADVVTFSHDNTRIRDIIFSANGKILIVKSGEEVQVSAKGYVTSPSIHLWDMETKRKTMAMADKEFGRASCISNDGNFLASREKNVINIMDLTTKKVFSTIKFDDNKFYKPIAFCNDNKGVVLEQGAVCSVYSIQSEKGVFVRNYSAPGLTHVVTKDDKYAIELFGDSFRIQDFKTGNDVHEFPLIDRGKPEALRGLIPSPEGRFFATLSDNKVRLWDLLSRKVAHNFTILPKDNIYCFSADGRFIIGGSDTLKIWELRTKREVATNIVGEGKISAATMSPDGKYLASGDAKGNIQIWSFSDDNMSGLYFAKEIANEIKQIPEKREFEKTEEYTKRRQKSVRSISNKYLAQYNEKLTTEQTIQEHWAEEDIRRAEEIKAQIAASREKVVFTIDSISAYNADKETFNIKIVNEKVRYSKWDAIKVPARDNPQCFKQRATTLTIEGVRQLNEDMKTFDIYNVKIKTNCSGKDKDYTFGHQRVYLEE